MSFFKFWKSKKSDDDISNHDSSAETSPTYVTGSYRSGSTETSSDTSLPVSPAIEEESNKKARKLSISRSGRYRAQKRERSRISDKPEMFQFPASLGDNHDSSAECCASGSDWTAKKESGTERSPTVQQTCISRKNSSNSNRPNVRQVTNEPISNFCLSTSHSYASQATAV